MAMHLFSDPGWVLCWAVRTQQCPDTQASASGALSSREQGLNWLEVGGPRTTWSQRGPYCTPWFRVRPPPAGSGAPCSWVAAPRLELINHLGGLLGKQKWLPKGSAGALTHPSAHTLQCGH